VPIGSNPIQILAALDQLIIKREINITRLEEQLEIFEAPFVGRQAVNHAVNSANVALQRLTRKRVEIVTRWF
jgi:hypothetical protein